MKDRTNLSYQAGTSFGPTQKKVLQPNILLFLKLYLWFGSNLIFLFNINLNVISYKIQILFIIKRPSV